MSKLFIPQNLNEYSVAGLRDLIRIAENEYKPLVTQLAANPTDADDDGLERAEQLKEFIGAAEAEIAEREKKAARVAKLAASDAPPKDDEEEGSAPESEDAGSEDEEDVKEMSGKLPLPPASQVVTATVTKGSPSISDVARISPDAVVLPRNDDHYTLVAAADLGGEFTSGQDLQWETIGKAFEERTRSYPKPQTLRKGAKHNRLQHTFAVVRREFPEEQQLLDSDGEMVLYRKLNAVGTRATEEVSRVAAAGWCAPSETIYSICNPVTAEGLLDLPEVVARRGGIRHNQGIDWVTFFGGTFPALDTNVPGMSLLTEAQVIADTAKTCLEIDCPAFVDDRLNVAALCLTGSLLQNRGYPEYVSEFTQGAMAAFAHFVNREIIDVLEDGSTAVNLGAANTFGTVMGTADTVSQVMGGVDFAATDIRYRMRLSPTAPIEIVLPLWLKVYMRTDWMRRNAVSNENLADAMISSMFATRNVRVQWVYDWQDAFSAVAGGAGATTPAVNFVTLAAGTLRFLAFAPGTWILARQDVIRLDTVYDSINLQQNLVTQLFIEDGWLPMRMCPQGMTRVYSIPICASGVSGGTFTPDCNPAA